MPRFVDLGLGLGLLAAATTLARHSAYAQVVEDTWEYGDLTPPAALVESTTAQLSFCPPRNVDVESGRPIPTNAWWGNLITCDQYSNYTQAVWANPFALSLETTSSQGLYGVALGYPFRYRYFGGVSSEGTARYYAHVAHKEVLLSATEFAKTTPTFRVADWSDMGVTVTLRLAPSTPQLLRTDLVNGMAFLSATYTMLSPRIAIQVPLATINDQGVWTGMVVTGRRFVLTTVNGLTWVLYTTSDVAFSVESPQVLRALQTFSGTVRVAPVEASTPLAVYDQFQDCVVLGGTVSIVSDAEYQLQWQTIGACANGLLQYALPHHLETLDTSAAVQTTVLSAPTLRAATRGEMRAVVTRSTPFRWVLREPSKVPITFYPRTRLSAADATQQQLYAVLRSEIAAPWSLNPWGSYYFNGKLAQKYASLCLMANDPVIVGSDVSFLRRCVPKLEALITPFLDNSWGFKLQYDRVYGGIVSSQGFMSNDLNADFGNTVYNDHHFHYGYWIYTAAVINYLHPTWSRLGELNRMARLLLRDVATPSSVDPFFPKFRSFDWFRGHSYSHGLTSFADGKDQESSSEDVNFSYALYLYGVATHHARMATIGNLMIKLNARAIRAYFLMEASNAVHPESFKRNKAPGIFFDNKVDYATWFSAEKFCIHGIQMIPVTPVTEYARSRVFVQEEWDAVLGKEPIVVNNDVNNPWISLLYANYARVNRTRALGVLQQAAMDDGLTRAWALYMAVQLS
ncbi:hypothetical protein P43SY_009209 [Pythium insidiosum]|uniref:glucan endo-1,3-beta-D-glucosidase n=1 Tax=Pythium insidiosum TaxID=114742 RepID=A0AAD5LNW4_PYTIN|nr:hypothetical protein P43SY_009209 [Pythium insidiosum]